MFQTGALEDYNQFVVLQCASLVKVTRAGDGVVECCITKIILTTLETRLGIGHIQNATTGERQPKHCGQHQQIK